MTVNFNMRCLKQDKANSTYRYVVNLFIVCESYTWSRVLKAH